VSQDKILENLNECLHDNFWLAFDSLEVKKVHILFKGIDLAKEM
jgi:hypothetical protein